MAETLLTVDGVSKKFCKDLKKSLWYGLQDLQYELFASGGNRHEMLRDGEFWAVNDVSFELKRGDSLALVGRNGAGKSTLLKLLNGLIKPDKGQITIHGRVGALIELGAGFNPVLTGRENVYVNGSILGFSQRELDAIFDDIVEFSELGDFIDTPVQYYSSGMKVRLGFAVAINMRPDVLLIDEVLAVGDVGFKNKCYNAVNKMIDNTAVIFVSHSVTQINKICNRGILLRNGRIHSKTENVEGIISDYFSEFKDQGEVTLSGSGEARLKELHITSGNETTQKIDIEALVAGIPQPRVEIYHGEPLTFECVIELEEHVEDFSVGLGFWDMENKSVAQAFSVNSNRTFFTEGRQQMLVRLSLENCMFIQGSYNISFGIFKGTDQNKLGKILAAGINLLQFHVEANDWILGGSPLQLNGIWDAEPYISNEPITDESKEVLS